MEHSNISVNNKILKDTLSYGETALLTYKIEYPEFISSEYAGCITGINRFYEERALSYERYCKTRLFRMAVRQYRDDLKHDYPIREFDIVQAYEVTYMQSCVSAFIPTATNLPAELTETR
jgi:hypothetical protein